MSPASGQGLRRRLFIVWTLWMWLGWLLSGEVQKTFAIPAILHGIISPPWPHAGFALLNALKAGGTTALILAALLGAGRQVLNIIRPAVPAGTEGPEESLLMRIFTARHLMEISAGIPVAALSAQGLGLLGLAGPAPLALLLAACAIPAIRGWKKPASGLEGGEGVSDGFPILASWGAVLAAGLAALAPEVAWDSMVYHLRAPELYLLAHKVYPIPEIFPSYFPFNGQMLLMLAKNLAGDPGAKLLHAAMWLACGAGTARLSASLWGRKAMPWGLALSLTLPLGMVVGSRAYVEFFLVLPVVCAAIMFFPRRSLGPASLLFVGWLAGTAAGTKHQGALAGLALVATALVHARRRGRGALLLLAGGTAASGAWFLRNILWTGNPVYPVFLGGPRWTPQDAAGWRSDASALEFSLRKLATTPWFLMKSPPTDGGISPMLLSAAAVPLLWRTARNGLWALAGAMLVLWWASAPLTRYLAPAIFLFSAAAAGTFMGRELGESGEKWCHHLARLGLALSLACGFSSIQMSTEPYGAATGKWTAAEYRHRRLAPAGTPEMLETLETIVPAGGRAYIMGHPFSYGLPRRAWTEFLYVRAPLHWWLDGAPDPREIAVRARQAGLTHIAWHEMGGRVFNGRVPEFMDWDDARLQAWAGFWSTRVREVRSIGLWHIYEITPQAGRYPLPQSVLPGTEAVLGPLDFALDRGDFTTAGRMARGDLARFPALSRYLADRLRRAANKQPSFLPISGD